MPKSSRPNRSSARRLLKRVPIVLKRWEQETNCNACNLRARRFSSSYSASCNNRSANLPTHRTCSRIQRSAYRKTILAANRSNTWSGKLTSKRSGPPIWATQASKQKSRRACARSPHATWPNRPQMSCNSKSPPVTISRCPSTTWCPRPPNRTPARM